MNTCIDYLKDIDAQRYNDLMDLATKIANLEDVYIHHNKFLFDFNRNFDCHAAKFYEHGKLQVCLRLLDITQPWVFTDDHKILMYEYKSDEITDYFLGDNFLDVILKGLLKIQQIEDHNELVNLMKQTREQIAADILKIEKLSKEHKHSKLKEIKKIVREINKSSWEDVYKKNTQFFKSKCLKVPSIHYYKKGNEWLMNFIQNNDYELREGYIKEEKKLTKRVRS